MQVKPAGDNENRDNPMANVALQLTLASWLNESYSVIYNGWAPSVGEILL
jgi:hypothetical protein